jgi:D-alanyl-D-alanine endopeptidase (penicillin-binding protein 7)
MKLVLRIVATMWAGGIAVAAAWAVAPLLGARPSPANAALPAALPEPGTVAEPVGGTATASLTTLSTAREFERSLVPVPPAGAPAPGAGWRTPGEAEWELADVPPGDWLPPVWYPSSADALAIDGISQHGPNTGPHVKSRSAIVYDIDAGAVIYEKNADETRPVASITKLVSALAWASAEPDPDREVVIGPEQYPTRSGARSRLSTGDITSGMDLLGAALVASDNRAALGLAAASNMHLDQFVGRMNAVSVELGMTHSSWVDPSGLEDENLSTARDIAKATLAVASHPVLAPVASAPFWDLWRSNKNYVRRLSSTDRLMGREDLLVETAKTGYTDTARYCFTTVLQTNDGRRLGITLLGADGKMTRWADVGRILNWVAGGQKAESSAPAAPTKAKKSRSKGKKRRR